MLTPADDYPLHQTADPIAFSGTDRNFYDRFFFNGYDREQNVFFALALGVYPHLDVMDGSLCVRINDRQYNLRCSKEMLMDRLNLEVGPLSVEIVEPLRQTRLVIADNEYGISKTFAKCVEKSTKILKKILELIDSLSDGLIRGGVVTALSRSAKDVARITKFYLTSRGIGFLAKQIGLQASNPDMESGSTDISSLGADLSFSRNRTFLYKI